MAKFRDFDEFRAEVEGTGPSFKLYGETHFLPPSMPVSLMARAAYLQETAQADAEIPADEIIRMADDLFGADNVKNWIGQGMDVLLLTELIAWVPDAYDDDEEDGADDLGNSQGVV